MLDEELATGPRTEIKKLSSNFVEEAGIRCFETHEFVDWLTAIQAVLAESGIKVELKVIQDLFGSLPDSADDEIFELTLKAYLLEKNI
jgi:hypothetical protein